jgi:membrane protease YdiL (CAAX protease family)
VTEPVHAPPQEREQRWGLGDAAAGWILAQALAVVAVGIVQAATGRTADQMDDAPLGVQFLPQIGLWMGLLGVPLLVTRLKGRGPVADLGLRATAQDAWRGGLLGVACQYALIPLYWPLLKLLDRTQHDLDKPAQDLVDKVHGPWAVALLIAWVAVLAPVVEEIFYRGLLLRALQKRGLPPAACIVLTGLLFGASHLEGLQLVALSLFGMVLAWLAVRTGRLGPSIAAHVGFNLVTVVALLSR